MLDCWIWNFCKFVIIQTFLKTHKNHIKYLIVKNYITPRMSFLSTEYVVTSINNLIVKIILQEEIRVNKHKFQYFK